MSATQTDRFYGVTGGLAVKAPCVTHSTGNITALSGLLTVNSVVLAAGDRVLVKDQTAGADNGIYIVATGAWTRAADFDGSRDVVQGTLCTIEGSTSATTWFKVTNTGTITIGTTALTFALVAAPIDTTISVGNLLYPRTSAESGASIDAYDADNTIGDIMFPQYEPGDVRRYGALGDNSNNDAAAFQAAFDQNVRTEHDAAEIKSGPHTYYIVGQLTLWDATVYNRSWYAQNTVMRWAANTNGIVIGPNTSGNQAKKCRITGSLQVENDIDHTTSTEAGLYFRNVRSGLFYVGAKKWQVGIYCFPHDNSFGYNKVYLGEVTRNNFGVRLKPGGTTGWVNSNSFYGGSFGTVTGQTYNWYIYIEKTSSSLSNGQPNMNRFHDLDFDHASGSTISGAYYDEGNWNQLLSPRMEMAGGTVSVASVKLLPKSSRAFILPGYDMLTGWESSGADNNTILDLGIENIVLGTDGLQISAGRGGYASEVIDVKRSLPNTGLVPVVGAHDLYDNGGPPQGFLANLNKTRALTATESWGFKVTQTGNLVSTGAAADGDLVYWECIDTHVSGASTEPGVGADWRDKWVNCKTDYVNGGAAAAWSASSVSYSERVDVARINSLGWYQFGPITAPQIMTGTVDPTGGVAAPRGSLYLRSNGTTGATAYAKHGAGDTDWHAL